MSTDQSKKSATAKKLIFRIVLLVLAAAVSGVTLLVYSTTQVCQLILPSSSTSPGVGAASPAVGQLTGWDWPMIMTVICASVSLTCLVAITGTFLELTRNARSEDRLRHDVPGNPDNS